eukprot:ctg_988.g324
MGWAEARCPHGLELVFMADAQRIQWMRVTVTLQAVHFYYLREDAQGVAIEVPVATFTSPHEQRDDDDFGERCRRQTEWVRAGFASDADRVIERLPALFAQTYDGMQPVAARFAHGVDGRALVIDAGHVAATYLHVYWRHFAPAFVHYIDSFISDDVPGSDMEFRFRMHDPQVTVPHDASVSRRGGRRGAALRLAQSQRHRFGAVRGGVCGAVAHAHRQHRRAVRVVHGVVRRCARPGAVRRAHRSAAGERAGIAWGGPGRPERCHRPFRVRRRHMSTQIFDTGLYTTLVTALSLRIEDTRPSAQRAACAWPLVTDNEREAEGDDGHRTPHFSLRYTLNAEEAAHAADIAMELDDLRFLPVAQAIRSISYLASPRTRPAGSGRRATGGGSDEETMACPHPRPLPVAAPRRSSGRGGVRVAGRPRHRCVVVFLGSRGPALPLRAVHRGAALHHRAAGSGGDARRPPQRPTGDGRRRPALPVQRSDDVRGRRVRRRGTAAGFAHGLVLLSRQPARCVHRGGCAEALCGAAGGDARPGAHVPADRDGARQGGDDGGQEGKRAPRGDCFSVVDDRFRATTPGAVSLAFQLGGDHVATRAHGAGASTTGARPARHAAPGGATG